ncbi:MAG: hypothetical protein ACK56F_17890, partial [bacterium]
VEESSSLQLHQWRRVRVFNFTSGGEFEPSTSPVESGTESSTSQSSRQLLFRCERDEAIGFAHQTERRQ